MSNLVIYLDVAVAEAGEAQETLTRAGKMPGVAKADVRVEETERALGGLDIASITLTITAIAGAVGATSNLLDKVRDLVKSVRGLRQVLVETPSGPKPLDKIVPADLQQS